jgi:RNA polymerase sigma-70 factor (ECF subfamily)
MNGPRSADDDAGQGADDAGLVDAALAGDSGAFDSLVLRYQSRAVAVAYRLLGNAHDAWEASQEAFIRAYRSLDSLKEHARFGPWLLRIVSNQALNFRRSRGAQRAVSLDDDPNAGRDSIVDGVAIGTERRPADDPVDGAEIRGAVQAAIDSLPEKQRLALVLFAIEGMPQVEVAEIIGCSVELVKWNVFQARKKLRLLLKDIVDR